MINFRDLSLNKKLISITMLTALVAVLLVLVFNLLAAYFSFRQSTMDSLKSFARITGANCSASIVFNDEGAAASTLEALRAEPQIESASVFTPEGKLFAEYARDTESAAEHAKDEGFFLSLDNEQIAHIRESGSYIADGNRGMTIFEPVMLDGEMIGIVEITSDRRNLYSAMTGIFILNLGILSIAFIVAVIIASRAQKTISGPIRKLMETVKKVSKEKDYSIRVKKQSNDELGTLFEMFNEMLFEIQKRDDKLQFIQYTVDHMKDAIFWTDRSARIIDANEKSCELMGCTKKELLSMTLFDFYPKLTPERWEESWEYVIKNKNLNVEIEQMRRDGTMFPTEVSVSNIEFNGKIYNCSFIRDITEKKKLQYQLEQAQKIEAIGTLAGGVAHDLNNILAGLIGYPDLLLLDLPEESPLRGPLVTIKKSGERAAAVVQDLLTLARRNVNVRKVVNINDIVSEFISSPEFGKIREFHSTINFRVQLDRDLPNILGSSVHILKVIMNLVSNAAESMSNHRGDVIISTKSCILDRDYNGFQQVFRGSYAILTVEDTGSGISNEDISNIFEPFYTRKIMGRSGTGLGMTIVSGVVKDHRGYIDLESIDGKGTRFDLYFPSTEEQMLEDKKGFSLKSYRGRESVLVIDDGEEQRELALYALEKLGYDVHVASSGEEALVYLKEHRADLVILDMIMDPGMDGLETYQKIVEMHPGQKALIASGYAENDKVKKTLELGAGGYVKKPYTILNLGIAVRDELDRG